MRLFACFFFFNDTATTEIYTLSLHDALPIYESSIAEPLVAALEREAFDVVHAATAAEGLEAAATRSPDLVLLDVMLPDGDGRDVLRQIRASSRVPVVMLTARGEEMDRVLRSEERR